MTILLNSIDTKGYMYLQKLNKTLLVVLNELFLKKSVPSKIQMT